MEKDFIDDLYDILTEKLKKMSPEDRTNDAYATMKYPRLFPLMRFHTNAFYIKGFGHVMLMRTNAMNGMMKLLTISLTPSEGLDMPYLLIDCMGMKNKNLAYVEYYDCTDKALKFESLLKIKGKYSEIPNYEEKPAWYIGERMEESMTKVLGKAGYIDFFKNYVMPI